MTWGQPFIGTDSSPKMLRDAGLRTKLTSLGWRVEDSGDLKFPSISSTQSRDEAVNAKNSRIVGESSKIIADEVFTKGESVIILISTCYYCIIEFSFQELASEEKFPLLLGGDHSVSIGSLAGILKARPRTGGMMIRFPL